MMTRDDMIAATGERYRKGDRANRGKILDVFTAITGFHRKHAARILRATGRRERGAPRPEMRLYNDEMDGALVTLWEASDRVCGKRLHAMLPLLVEAMERHGHMTLLPAIRAGILTMSAATIDRRLAPFREGAKRRRRAPPSAAVKAAVPVRTFADWGDPSPGFFEADLVAHSGPSADGRFVQTLTLTDIASGWTETMPIPFREQEYLVQALTKLQRSLPMPILGLDTDNDTVFMNETIQAWCAVHNITFTRSRPYHKNDQAWVEQKNGSVVRKLVGYRRYEGLEALQILENLYAASRLFVNLLQPSFKLISKERHGAKVIKRYDKPVTPCQRLLADARVSNAIKTQLSTMQASLDPIDLLARMRHCQQQLLNLSQDEQVEGAIQPDARLGDFLASLKDAWHSGTLEEPARPQRTWRTRVDPFAATATEVTALFESAMGQTSRDLFEQLCADHPGLYLPGQLRTFERQRKRWRAAKADALILGAAAVAAE
ncbi:transposase [Sphingomonas sp. LH128]|mgnify:FL=1|nr:transposase [Sphingomonas sp. LH128]